MESNWIRHHKRKAPAPYVPKVEPAPETQDDVNDDHELLPDRGPATLSDEDIAVASLDPDDPRVQIARMVIENLNNYKKGA